MKYYNFKIMNNIFEKYNINMEKDILKNQIKIKNNEKNVKITKPNINCKSQQGELFYINNNKLTENKRKCTIFKDDIIIEKEKKYNDKN